MLFLLYTATFVISWSFSRNPFFAALLATAISVALCCLAFLFPSSRAMPELAFLPLCPPMLATNTVPMTEASAKELLIMVRIHVRQLPHYQALTTNIA